MLRLYLSRKAADESEREGRRENGILFGSGLVGGEGLLGVGIAISAGYAAARDHTPWSIGYEWAGSAGPWLAFGFFLVLAAFFWRVCLSEDDAPSDS